MVQVVTNLQQQLGAQQQQVQASWKDWVIQVREHGSNRGPVVERVS